MSLKLSALLTCIGVFSLLATAPAAATTTTEYEKIFAERVAELEKDKAEIIAKIRSKYDKYFSRFLAASFRAEALLSIHMGRKIKKIKKIKSTKDEKEAQSIDAIEDIKSYEYSQLLGARAICSDGLVTKLEDYQSLANAGFPSGSVYCLAILAECRNRNLMHALYLHKYLSAIGMPTITSVDVKLRPEFNYNGFEASLVTAIKGGKSKETIDDREYNITPAFALDIGYSTSRNSSDRLKQEFIEKNLPICYSVNPPSSIKIGEEVFSTLLVCGIIGADLARRDGIQ